MRVGRVGKEYATLRQLFLRGLWPVRIDRPGMYTGGFQHHDWDVQKSGTLNERQEEGQDDLPPLMGSRDPVRDVIRTVGDGGGSSIPGEIEGQSSVLGMW